MNDKERQMWIDNDEELYDMKCNSNRSMRGFIKAYRHQIDEIIRSRHMPLTLER